MCICVRVCLFVLRTGGLASWPAGEGFIAATGKGVWIEDDQAGSPEEKLSPVSSCLVPSRLVSRAAVPYRTGAEKLADHDENLLGNVVNEGLRGGGGRAWLGCGRAQQTRRLRSVLSCTLLCTAHAVLGVLPAAGYCGTHGGVLVGLAGTALLSADGFNATSQSAQSQPALNLPFAPSIPSLLGSHPRSTTPANLWSQAGRKTERV